MSYTIKDNEKAVIGRSTECQITINDTKVSRKHTTFFIKNRKLYVKDNGSTNGTFVNNKKIFEKKLSCGDDIRLGTTYIKCFEKQVAPVVQDLGKSNSDEYFEGISQASSNESTGISNYIKELSGQLLSLKNSSTLSKQDQEILSKMNQTMHNIEVNHNNFLREHHIIQSLHKINEIINQILDVTDLLVNMMDIAMNILKARRGLVFLNQSSISSTKISLEKNLYVDMINGFIFSKPSIELENINIDMKIMNYSLEHSLAIVTNNLENDSRFKSLAGNPFFKDTKAVMIVPISSQKKKVGVILFDIPKNEKKVFTDNDLVFMDSYSTQCAISLENAFLYTEIREVYFSTIQVLSSALDAKDSYTEGHSQRVTEYSLAVAEELKLPKNEIEMIQIAAILHDIGKIGIRDLILCKPGKLTKDEFDIIKNHPSLGAEIVSHIAFLADKAKLIKHHHERFDGKGYPDGLKEQEIPIGSRIIAVCDSFDAMTSKRSYRENIPVHKALAELNKCSGTQFDAEIANTFIKVFNRDFLSDFEQKAALFKKQDIVENE